MYAAPADIPLVAAKILAEKRARRTLFCHQEKSYQDLLLSWDIRCHPASRECAGASWASLAKRHRAAAACRHKSDGAGGTETGPRMGRAGHRARDAAARRSTGSGTREGRDRRLRQVPDLVGVPCAVPDLQLGSWCGGPSRVVQAPARLRVVQRPVGLRYEDLRRGAIAVVQVYLRAVRGSAAVDVHALTQCTEGAAGLHDRPLLRAASVACVHLDGREVRGVRALHVHAQSGIAGDGPGGTATAAATAAAPAGGVRGDVAHAHRAA